MQIHTEKNQKEIKQHGNFEFPVADTIRMAEDRELFKEAMDRIGQPCAESEVAESLEDCLKIAARIGYPVVIRPAYTLGGSGGGIAHDKEELATIASLGLHRSRLHLGQPLLFLCHLKLCDSQVFFGAAALAALDVRVPGSDHVLIEIVVRPLQRGRTH